MYAYAVGMIGIGAVGRMLLSHHQTQINADSLTAPRVSINVMLYLVSQSLFLPKVVMCLYVLVTKHVRIFPWTDSEHNVNLCDPAQLPPSAHPITMNMR